MKIRAFTLAEVLITLGVIGIIAAMTLPSVIRNYKAKVLETQFKQSYSILSQIILRAQSESGEQINVQNFAYTTYGNSTDKLYNLLKPYVFSNFCKTKKCKFERETDEYGIEIQVMKSYRNYINTSNAASYYFESGGQFILPDKNIMLEVWNNKNLMISVDINGIDKKPNRWGHDLFTFSIDNNTGKLIPNGIAGSFKEQPNAFCFKTGTNNEQVNGLTCSYYALTDKDYFKNLPR